MLTFESVADSATKSSEVKGKAPVTPRKSRWGGSRVGAERPQKKGNQPLSKGKADTPIKGRQTESPDILGSGGSRGATTTPARRVVRPSTAPRARRSRRNEPEVNDTKTIDNSDAAAPPTITTRWNLDSIAGQWSHTPPSGGVPSRTSNGDSPRQDSFSSPSFTAFMQGGITSEEDLSAFLKKITRDARQAVKTAGGLYKIEFRASVTTEGA